MTIEPKTDRMVRIENFDTELDRLRNNGLYPSRMVVGPENRGWGLMIAGYEGFSFEVDAGMPRGYVALCFPKGSAHG